MENFFLCQAVNWLGTGRHATSLVIGSMNIYIYIYMCVCVCVYIYILLNGHVLLNKLTYVSGRSMHRQR